MVLLQIFSYGLWHMKKWSWRTLWALGFPYEIYPSNKCFHGWAEAHKLSYYCIVFRVLYIDTNIEWSYLIPWIILGFGQTTFWSFLAMFPFLRLSLSDLGSIPKQFLSLALPILDNRGKVGDFPMNASLKERGLFYGFLDASMWQRNIDATLEDSTRT